MGVNDRKFSEQTKHATALLVEFKYGVDNDYETGANMKMATASLAHGINIAFSKKITVLKLSRPRYKTYCMCYESKIRAH